MCIIEVRGYKSFPIDLTSKAATTTPPWPICSCEEQGWTVQLEEGKKKLKLIESQHPFVLEIFDATEKQTLKHV